MTLSNTAYISLGSNIEPETNLQKAVKLLRERCTVLAHSGVYRTAPQGDPHQPDFLNMALKVSTSLTPQQFKMLIIADIEQALGRVRDPNNKNAPRTIDLDIALWNDAVLDYSSPPRHIPDPDILHYAHATVPLAEIAPDYVHPETGQTLAEMAAALDTTGIHHVPLKISGDRLFIVNPEGAIWHEGRYLMVVRGAEEDHAAGVLAFIGGGVEKSEAMDNILEATLRREILEEVSIEISDMAYVMSRLFYVADKTSVMYMIFLCRYHAGRVYINDPGEVAQALWLTPEEIVQHPACPPWMKADIRLVEAQRLKLGW